MRRPTYCETCLQPTRGEACTRHPHDDLLDAEYDAHWLEALQEQRRQRALRWFLPLGFLFALSLSFASGPWGLLMTVVLVGRMHPQHGVY